MFFFPRKGREFATCANLSTVCHVLSLFSAPCDKFGKKAYTELSLLDVMSSIWTLLTQQITPFRILSIFNHRAIQFTLNPSHNPKKYPTTFSPPMTKRLHWHSTFSNLKSHLYGSAAVGQHISSTRPKLSQDPLSTRILAALPRQINCLLKLSCMRFIANVLLHIPANSIICQKKM